jgi:uncharacterized oligopeptide transporter (OPT) family protein
MGMYLPMPTTLPVVIGAVLGHVYNRWANASAIRRWPNAWAC